MVRTAAGADAVVIGTTESVASLSTATTHAMDVGTVEVHDVIHRDGTGATTIDGTMTGGGATIASATHVGGPATIDGETTSGAIDGARTVGAIDVTAAIDLFVGFNIGIDCDNCPKCGTRFRFNIGTIYASIFRGC